VLLVGLGLVAVGAGRAPAQQFGSYRMGNAGFSNYGTPGASPFRPSSYGMARPSYGMPNFNYSVPTNYGALTAGVAVPAGALPFVPGARVTGNFADFVNNSAATANIGVQQAANVAGTVQQLLPPALLQGNLEALQPGVLNPENPEAPPPGTDLSGAAPGVTYEANTAATPFAGLSAAAAAAAVPRLQTSQGYYSAPGTISTGRYGYSSTPMYSSSYSALPSTRLGYYRGP
jgi:hypothetical protein